MARRGLPTLEEALTIAGFIPEWIERGREQGMEIAARNALAEGASIEFVNKITGLPIETLEQIAASNEMRI